MSLPVIDISTLPSLAQFTGAQHTGVFGSQQSAQLSSSDDSIVILATFLYDSGGGTG